MLPAARQRSLLSRPGPSRFSTPTQTKKIGNRTQPSLLPEDTAHHMDSRGTLMWPERLSQFLSLPLSLNMDIIVVPYELTMVGMSSTVRGITGTRGRIFREVWFRIHWRSPASLPKTYLLQGVTVFKSWGLAVPFPVLPLPEYLEINEASSHDLFRSIPSPHELIGHCALCQLHSLAIMYDVLSA